MFRYSPHTSCGQLRVPITLPFQEITGSIQLNCLGVNNGVRKLERAGDSWF